MNFLKKIIKETLEEILLTTHFNDRLKDRVESVEKVVLPKDLKEVLKDEDIDISFFSDELLRFTKNNLINKINNSFKIIKSQSYEKFYIYKIGKVLIKKNGKIYTPSFIGNDENAGKYRGNVWFSPVYNGSAITLILTNTDNDFELIKQTQEHYERNKKSEDNHVYEITKDINNFDVKELNDYVLVFDYDNYSDDFDEFKKDIEFYKNVKKREEERKQELKDKVNYKKTYKKGGVYIHPKFGRGIINSTKTISKDSGIEVKEIEVNFDNPEYGLKRIRFNVDLNKSSL